MGDTITIWVVIKGTKFRLIQYFYHRLLFNQLINSNDDSSNSKLVSKNLFTTVWQFSKLLSFTLSGCCIGCFSVAVIDNISSARSTIDWSIPANLATFVALECKQYPSINRNRYTIPPRSSSPMSKVLYLKTTGFSKQPIRTRYLGHVTGYQPIRDQYQKSCTGGWVRVAGVAGGIWCDSE